MAALLIIRDEWDISSSQAGLLNSLFADGALVIIPLADRVSPGNALAFSGITCAIGSLLFPLLASNVATGAPLRFLAFVLMTGGIIESADAAARAAIVVGAAGMLALTFLYSFAVGADSAIYSTAITEVAESGKLGSTLAVHTFSAFAAGFLSPIIFGGILDVAGDDIGWGLGFGTAGIAAVAAIGAMTWLRTQRPAGAQLGGPNEVA
ncbi:MAG: hypothetical protein IIC82_09640 [Chloroflexi bacterium]|nr:hypothetical protein [Chloroflexota bacterium]